MRKLGFKIPEGLRFAFKNDKEEEVIALKELNKTKQVADIVKTLSDSGFTVDPNYITELTGVPLSQKPEPTLKNPTITNSAKEKLSKLYSGIGGKV